MKRHRLSRHHLLPIVLCGLVFLGIPRVGQAQISNQDQAPFHSVSLYGMYSHPVSSRGISEWNQRLAVQAGLQIPFYTGRIEAGVHGQQWQTLNAALPDWNALFVFAGWQAVGAVNARTNLSGGVRIGNYVMMFDTDAVVGQRRESEFSVAPVVGLRVRLWNRMELHAEAMWVRVLTRPVIDSRQVSAGLSTTLDMPRWLEALLK